MILLIALSILLGYQIGLWDSGRMWKAAIRKLIEKMKSESGQSVLEGKE